MRGNYEESASCQPGNIRMLHTLRNMVTASLPSVLLLLIKKIMRSTLCGNGSQRTLLPVCEGIIAVLFLWYGNHIS